MKSVILSAITSMGASVGLSSSSYGRRVKPRARFHGQSQAAKAAAISKANARRKRRDDVRSLNDFLTSGNMNPLQYRTVSYDPETGAEIFDGWAKPKSGEVAQ